MFLGTLGGEPITCHVVNLWTLALVHLCSLGGKSWGGDVCVCVCLRFACLIEKECEQKIPQPCQNFTFLGVFREFLTGFSHNRVCPHVPHATHKCSCKKKSPKTDEFSPKKVQRTQTTQKKGKCAHPFWNFAHFYAFLRLFTHLWLEIPTSV